MLTTDDIIKQLTNNRTKGFVDRLAVTLREEKFDLNKLIDLTFIAEDKISFRAVWLLDATILGQPELYIDNLPYLVLRMKDVRNASCKRQYARIMMFLTAHNAPASVKIKMQAIDMEHIVEQCFDWMIDPQIKVAVQVFAAGTLFNLRHRYDWITDELTNQLQFMLRDGGPAVQSAGKRLVAGLNEK
jgi:hypothetical protein